MSGKLPKNYSPFAERTFGSNLEISYSDRNGKMFDLSYRQRQKKDPKYSFAMIMSGMSFSRPQSIGIPKELNAPKIVLSANGEKQWKVKIKLIDDTILKSDSIMFTDMISDVMVNSSLNDKEINVKNLPDAYSTTTKNWFPIFGSIVYVEKVRDGAYYIRRVVKDQAINVSFYQQAASFFNLPWDQGPMMGGGVDLGEDLVENLSTPQSLAAGIPPYSGKIFLKYPVGTRKNYVYVTSVYGMRKGPKTGRWAMHTGIDIGVKIGDPIYAANDGEVIKVSGNASATSGYGLRVILRHENGYKTTYSHLSQVMVSVGSKVIRGSTIALGGSSGGSTGPHLHYEVLYNNKFIDPFSHPAIAMFEGQTDNAKVIEQKTIKQKNDYLKHIGGI